jgi:hypothetical protein
MKNSRITVALIISSLTLILLYSYVCFGTFNLYDIVFKLTKFDNLPGYNQLSFLKSIYDGIFLFFFIIINIVFIAAMVFVINFVLKKSNSLQHLKDKKVFSEIPNEHSVTYFTFTVLRKHPIEIISIFIILIILSLLFIHEKFSNHTKYFEIIIGFSLSIFSILTGILGMYFAFLAEDKSNKLLDQRSSFFEGFKHFLEILNKEILDENLPNRPKKYELYKSEPDNKNVTSFYVYKFILLTPFLGHAGIPLKNSHTLNKKKVEDIYTQHERFMDGIRELSNYYNCLVQFTIPTVDQIFRWYGLIQFLENLKNKLSGKKTIKEQIDNDLFSNEIFEKTKNFLYQIGNMDNIETQNSNKLKSFRQYIDYWKGENTKNILYTFRKDIPFQGLIVVKYESNFPITENKASKIIEAIKNKNINVPFLGKLKEIELESYISLVGSSTFKNVFNNLTLVGSRNHTMGLNDLFTKLHSTFKSEDPRMLKILNNHYSEIWNVLEVHNSLDLSDDIEKFWNEHSCKEYVNELIKKFK